MLTKKEVKVENWRVMRHCYTDIPYAIGCACGEKGCTGWIRSETSDASDPDAYLDSTETKVFWENEEGYVSFTDPALDTPTSETLTPYKGPKTLKPLWK